MAFKFAPKPESEVNKRFEILANGRYPFTVLESGIVASKSEKNSGRLMVKVNLVVHGPAFDTRIYDYFADWFSEWKLKHFCETTGMAKQYVAGEVDPSENAWLDKTGFVKIGSEPDKKTGDPRNVVVDYMPDDSQKAELFTDAPAAAPEPDDSDVPF